jgi:PAS domain S-box-containing protein
MKPDKNIEPPSLIPLKVAVPDVDPLRVINQDQFLKMISEIEDYAILLLDVNGYIVTWNLGAEKIKGYTREEIIGKHYRIFYPHEDKEAKLPERLLEQAARERKAVYEGWRIKKDGTRFWGSIVVTAVHDDLGNITGFLKVTRDLTDKKILEDSYSNHLEELRQKNEEIRKKEERYHRMIQEVKDYAIILLDRQGTILDWNQGAEKLQGYTPAEILGKSFRLFYTKEDKEAKLPELLLKEATDNGSVSHEGWRIKKDGTRFWGSVSITALHDDSGNIFGYSKVTRDLTSRKIAEDKLSNFTEELKDRNEHLRQSEERYHKMISEVQDYAIILLSKEGIIQNWNEGASYIKGYSADEIVGKSFKVFYPREDAEKGLPEELLSTAAMYGKVVHEGWRVKKDGTKFWGSVVISALHDDANNIIGFSKVTRDLTERKKAEESLKASAEELERKNRELERANEELSSFAFIASHDLKEPLRKVRTFASRLTDENLSKQGQDYMTRIQDGARRMQVLIDDLLSFSQISNGMAEAKAVNLNDVVRSVKEDLEVTIGEKNALISSAELPTIKGLYFQFHQMFLNLLSNSLKFSKVDGQPVITIDYKISQKEDLPIQLDHKKSYHHITVTDNGIGFAQENATKIFNAFQRLHTRADYSGSGLGLSIVKKVVENLKGLALAEGQQGIGAAFHIYIPV